MADFGIRGLDLAYALTRPYDAAIIVDAIAGGRCPGLLRIVQPDTTAQELGAGLDNHHTTPPAVLALARQLGPLPPQVFLVGCEATDAGDGESIFNGLSAPVSGAVEKAAVAVLELARLLLSGRSPEEIWNTDSNQKEVRDEEQENDNAVCSDRGACGVARKEIHPTPHQGNQVGDHVTVSVVEEPHCPDDVTLRE